MVDGGAFTLQLMRMALGFMAGLLAAGLFIAWGFFRILGADGDPAAFAAIIGTGLVSASVLGALAAIPALFAIGISEAMRWRSITYHVGIAGVIALVIWTMGGELAEPGGASGTGPEVRPGSTIAVAAGFIGGAIYWLIAGRRAGCWLKREAEEPSSTG